MAGLYAIIAVDDTPYSEGIECWCRCSLPKLLDILKDQWDWMQDIGELEIISAQFEQKGHQTLDFIPPRPERRDLVDNPKYQRYLNEALSSKVDLHRKSQEDQDEAQEEAEEEAFEKIKNEYDQGQFIDELDLSEYPVYPKLPSEIYFCKSCTVFYPQEGDCKYCEDPVESIQGKIRC